MDGTNARQTSSSLELTEPKQTQLEIEQSPALRLAGTLAYQGIDPTDERLGALRNACCLLERMKAEAVALDARSQNRGDPMTMVTGRSSLDAAVGQLELMIRTLDEAVMHDIEQAVGTPR